MAGALERAIRRFRRGSDDDRGTARRISAAEFRAVTEERLRALEREVAEVKSRVNRLFFVMLAAVATEAILKLFE